MKRDKLAAQLHAVYDRLYAVYGDCTCPLEHQTPFQLLVAVILSAQCRDDRVNAVTGILFRRYPDAAAMSRAEPMEVGTIIHRLGLWRNKAESLVALSRLLVEKFDGRVPDGMADLTTLPGVGRKSANVVLGNAFGIPGFPVDTHVRRLLKHLWKQLPADTPEALEKLVNERVEPDRWTNFSHLLITHGRRVCHARTPECTHCVLAELCPDRKIVVENA